MAATNGTDSVERHQEWYDPDITSINQEMRSLLENYSAMEPDAVVKHVNDIVGLPHHLSEYTQILNAIPVWMFTPC